MSKILPEGEYLTHSTISDLIDDDQGRLIELAEDVLRCNDKVSSELEASRIKLEAAKKEYYQAEARRNWNVNNVGAVLKYMKNNFDSKELNFVKGDDLFFIREHGVENGKPMMYFGITKLGL